MHVFQYARKDHSDRIVLNVVTLIVVMCASSKAGNVLLVAALDGLDPVATPQVLDTLDFFFKHRNHNLVTEICPCSRCPNRNVVSLT